MHLKIQHSTAYRFETPMRYVVQSHRLEPSRFDGQTVLSWSIEVEDARFGEFHTDAAGDRVRTMTLNGPLSDLRIQVTGEIVTRDTNGVLAGHPERISPLVYLRETAPTTVDTALRELAASVDPAPPLERAHALSAAVADAIAYRPGTTHAHTTAAEALSQGEGVCQDHAHALIAIARHTGLPARYVSGYLHATDEDVPHEAGHAWAELFIKDLGWTGFDPANRCCPDERYVRLGSGLDARDAAPIRGISLGRGTEELDVTVAVDAVQQ